MVLVPFPAIFAAFAIVASGGGSATPPALRAHPEPQHVACIPVNGHQGQPGCWELGSVPISTPAGTDLYWHVYEFRSVETAQKAGDEHSRIIEAYGRVWLEAVATEQWRARGGRHVATVGPSDGIVHGSDLHSRNAEQGSYPSRSGGLGGLGR
jgi:hypothetical protein